ncbi:MAG: hypothetical protein CSA62_14005 [Planctomycetota bacterium]|nr:MAG: hypothetical protein CSA62_14005 [Planctomycetota bacterium]
MMPCHRLRCDTKENMDTGPFPEPVQKRLCEGLRYSPSRVLCLAPPGELGPVAALYLAAPQAGRQVRALLAGDPYLHTPLPAGLSLIQGDPGRAERPGGPYDLVVAWASEAFIPEPRQWLAQVIRSLRPGGRLQLDLPCAGFCPVLEACHPDAASWTLPQAAELQGWLQELRLRELELSTWIELRIYQELGDLLEDWTRPFPLHFEGQGGQQRLAQLRQNLASAFEGASELSLALRRAHIRAMR